jgi:hypothetical protein
MARRARLILMAVTACVAVLILTSRQGGTLEAQDAGRAAAQYLAVVMLAPGDSGMSGYRLVQVEEPAVMNDQELAARQLDYESGPSGALRLRSFRLTGRVFRSADAGQAMLNRFRQSQSFSDGTGNVIEFEWMGSIPSVLEFGAVEHGEFFRFSRRNDAGQIVETGTGAAWRRDAVLFTISAAGPTGLDNSSEVVRLLAAQDAKAARAGPFRPTVPPSLQPPRAVPAGPTTGMGVIGTAQISGELARDGTAVKALVEGKTCGSATTVFGFFLMTVESEAQTPGCGAPGAQIAFTVDGLLAGESMTWAIDNLFTPITLTTLERPRGGERLARPTLSIDCRPLPGRDSCSEQEQRLWRSDLRTWLQQVSTLDEVLSAWLRFRAGRGEAFGALLLGFFEQEPYTIISAVQFAGSDAEPEPYVTVIHVGAPIRAGGWKLTTGTDAQYTFPEGFVLVPGVCRIYLGSNGDPADNTCPDAFFSGAGGLATRNEGYFLLTDQTGQRIDAVAW